MDTSASELAPTCYGRGPLEDLAVEGDPRVAWAP
ncbi:hypothetical protein JOF53_000920 [Crossiella equi]|uniref:Uncharacterized protein n=1 Tax=Crossiella equi TaxID=130796 RepID=A0ABS5A614_9PSEU|nr:hypothetical protein [Crossiella equi]